MIYLVKYQKLVGVSSIEIEAENEASAKAAFFNLANIENICVVKIISIDLDKHKTAAKALETRYFNGIVSYLKDRDIYGTANVDRAVLNEQAYVLKEMFGYTEEQKNEITKAAQEAAQKAANADGFNSMQ